MKDIMIVLLILNIVLILISKSPLGMLFSSLGAICCVSFLFCGNKDGKDNSGA